MILIVSAWPYCALDCVKSARAGYAGRPFVFFCNGGYALRPTPYRARDCPPPSALVCCVLCVLRRELQVMVDVIIRELHNLPTDDALRAEYRHLLKRYASN